MCLKTSSTVLPVSSAMYPTMNSCENFNPTTWTDRDLETSRREKAGLLPLVETQRVRSLLILLFFR